MKRYLSILLIALSSLSLAAQTATDSWLFEAYRHENMAVWKQYINSQPSPASTRYSPLLYEYGYCGYIVAEAKKEGNESLLTEAKQAVRRFKAHVEQANSVPYNKEKGMGLPPGHYEMYRSAVLVYELRLHESVHPLKSMNLAKEAVKLAPNDPLTLSYYGTCLFYAPKPFGSKSEALEWFLKAQKRFSGSKWKECWVREANEMYINQCREKLKKH